MSNQLGLLSSHKALAPFGGSETLFPKPHKKDSRLFAPTPTSRSSRTTSVLPYKAASWSAVPVLVWRLISMPAFRSCLWWAGV